MDNASDDGTAELLRAEFGSLSAYAQQYKAAPATRPKRLTLPVLKTLSTSPESVAMSKDLKKRGWSFVGPTTVYAFMQAMGLVNDHAAGCDARDACERERAAFSKP